MKKKVQNLKVAACIQARLDSKRLPKKVLRKILGKTLIQIEFERLKQCREVDRIALVTSVNKKNDILADHAKSIGLAVVRDSEKDLILRYLKAARVLGTDALIRITADCPFVDPTIVDEMVKIYRRNPNKYDLITNILIRSFPKGLDVDIIPTVTLEKLDEEIKNSTSRELFFQYIMDNSHKFRIYNYLNSKDLSKMRWTVDYIEDLWFVEKVFQKLYKPKVVFRMRDILLLLEKDSGLARINQKYQ